MWQLCSVVRILFKYFNLLYKFAASTLLQDSTQYSYNGLVYLAHSPLSRVYKGIASIRINGNDLPLCDVDSQFNSIMGNSVCRQLGYTNSRMYETIE